LDIIFEDSMEDLNPSSPPLSLGTPVSRDIGKISVYDKIVILKNNRKR